MAVIDKAWIKRDLQVTIYIKSSGNSSDDDDDNNDDNVLVVEPHVITPDVGPPLVLDMTLFDIHFLLTKQMWIFPTVGPTKLPCDDPCRRCACTTPPTHCAFDQLVIPPQAGILAAVHCTSTDDYQDQTGQAFDDTKRLAETSRRPMVSSLATSGWSVHADGLFINIANVPSGGESWGYGGMGSLQRFPVFHHELGQYVCQFQNKRERMLL